MHWLKLFVIFALLKIHIGVKLELDISSIHLEKLLKYKTYFTFFSRTSLSIIAEYSLDIYSSFREKPPKLNYIFLSRPHPINENIFQNTETARFILSFEDLTYTVTLPHRPHEYEEATTIGKPTIRKFTFIRNESLTFELKDDKRYEIEGSIDFDAEDNTLDINAVIVEKESKNKLFV